MSQWEECSIDDATHVEINGEVHELIEGGTVERSVEVGWIYILIDNKWVHIPQEAFPFLGIRCLWKFKPKPIEFEGEVVVGTFHGADVTMLLVTGILVGEKFHCVQIMEDEE